MPRDFKPILKKIAEAKANGPATTFSVPHLVRCMRLIAEAPIGRARLAGKLKIGEGAIRTIIRRLTKAGLISTTANGNALTQKGRDLWKQIQSVIQITETKKNDLANADYNFAVIVRCCSRSLGSGIEQRDKAVSAGAKTATTLVYENGQLRIPSVSENIARDFPKAASQLIKELKPKEKDIIIMAGADSPEDAENGALASAWSLLDQDLCG